MIKLDGGFGIAGTADLGGMIYTLREGRGFVGCFVGEIEILFLRIGEIDCKCDTDSMFLVALLAGFWINVCCGNTGLVAVPGLLKTWEVGKREPTLLTDNIFGREYFNCEVPTI